MSYTQTGSLVDLADPDLAVEATREMADVGGDWLLAKVVENTPVSYTGVALQVQGFEVSRVPGTLKRSWKRLPVELAVDVLHGGFQVRVETLDRIAPYVEWDTKPHEITPKKGPYLVFRTWPFGRLVRTKLVKHPGTTGQHMMSFAVHAATLGFAEIVDRPLHAWAEKQEAAAR